MQAILPVIKGCEWGADYEQAFPELKQYLASSHPLLTIPTPTEQLLLYFAVSNHVVSAALLRVKGAEQVPVYCMSKTLLNGETRYLPLEKLVLALLTESRKLPHYFEAHPIVVYTKLPPMLHGHGNVNRIRVYI